MKLGYVLLIAIALAVAGCAGMSRKDQAQYALQLTKEHFSSTATVQDDPLDTIATITTKDGFQEKRGIAGAVWNDNFLRAFIDKRTGKTDFQIYQVIYYQSASWKFFMGANYETPAGPATAPVTMIGRDVDCPGSRYLECTFTEHLGFDIDEGLLREIAARHQPGRHAVWKFKFNAKSGPDYQDGMLPTEIAGLLDAVDAYRAKLAMADATRKVAK